MAEQANGLRLFNTLQGQVEPFAPLDPDGKRVNMYVCGPTVYDDAHLGHARCYITWDVLYRFLTFLGYDVKYVRNVTDVDDKILNRAKERGETPAELAERNYQSFTEDMAALNVLPPDEEPRATQYIRQMLDGIQTLIAKGAAYATPDGSVYFRVVAKPDYGKLKYATQDTALLKKHLDDLKAGARVEVEEGKESPLDFALWKAVPLDDPNGWESPWPPTQETSKGWGRPGWHMECSAMNHAVFGEQIDIHAGGADLIFPHHENEIAQSEAWTGQQPFSKYWLHNGFVNVSGEKMSKSLGNFSTIKKVLARYDANTIRYFLLTNHYRMPVDFNDEALQAAENWVDKTFGKLKKLNITREELNKVLFKTAAEVKALEQGLNLEDSHFSEFLHLMEVDLNTAQGLAILNRTFTKMQLANAQGDYARAMELFQRVVNMMNVLGFSFESLFEGVSLPAAEIHSLYVELAGHQTNSAEQAPETMLEEIVTMRREAKASKNWAQADAIRKQLTDIGLQILDNKDGTTTVEKDGLEIVRV